MPTLHESTLHRLARLGDHQRIFEICRNRAQINLKDEKCKTPLHVAVEAGKIRAIRALVASGANLNIYDNRGCTPLDIALSNKNNQAIVALGGSVESREYGKVKISQHIVNQKLRDYVRVSQVDFPRNSVLSNKGNCNGWAFLYQYYLSNHAEFEFYEILRVIAKWDGRRVSLSEKVSNIGWVSEVVKSKYNTIGDIFESTINDVLWFQHSSELKNEVKSSLHQKTRSRQWQMVDDDKMKLSTQFSFLNLRKNISKEIFTQMLKCCQNCSNHWLDIGYFTNNKSGHAVSVYINNEGRFKYYNSNYYFQLKDSYTAEEIADFVYANKKNLMLKSFCIHHFINKQSPEPQGRVNTTNRYNLVKNATLFGLSGLLSCLALMCQSAVLIYSAYLGSGLLLGWACFQSVKAIYANRQSVVLGPGLPDETIERTVKQQISEFINQSAHRHSLTNVKSFMNYYVPQIFRDPTTQSTSPAIRPRVRSV